MKVIQFKDEALKRNVSLENVRCTFANEIDEKKILGIITPSNSEAICFEPDEIDTLIVELSSGKIALENLAEQQNLTIYQIRLVLEHLLETNQIKGELTYSTFISNGSSKKSSLFKSAEHKKKHRLKMKNKR